MICILNSLDTNSCTLLLQNITADDLLGLIFSRWSVEVDTKFFKSVNQIHIFM